MARQSRPGRDSLRRRLDLAPPAPVGSAGVTEAGAPASPAAPRPRRPSSSRACAPATSAAFEALVERHYAHDARRSRRPTCSTRAVAEEVVQEAWLGVLKGLDRFEGRSSLKTWILRILVNIAKTRGVREARSVPFASLAPEGDEPAVEPERFRERRRPFPGHWRASPGDWQRAARGGAARGARRSRSRMAAIEPLPPAQRTVITHARHRRAATPEEVCAALEISEGNQRVLLHRARSRVRAALERHLDG